MVVLVKKFINPTDPINRFNLIRKCKKCVLN